MIGWPRIDDYPGEQVAEPAPLRYRWFGWWYRWQACKLAAQTIGSPSMAAFDNKGLLLWSFTVFFESYMVWGAEWTRADYGPKEPVDLKLVKVTPAMKVVS